MKALGPAFIVVADDVLADPCLFVEICRWMDIIGVDAPVILDGDAQTVNRLAARLAKGSKKPVGKIEIIGGGVIFISGEIRKYCRDIHKMPAKKPAGIMEPGVGDMGFG